MEVKYPQVKVKLTGKDGNVFAIIGTVSSAIRKEVGAKEAGEFQVEATNCGSYDEVLQLLHEDCRRRMREKGRKPLFFSAQLLVIVTNKKSA